VLPASEELRRVLKHPNGMAFRSSGSVEWPDDKFTQRRIADGSITIEKKDESSDKPAQDKPAPRTHSPG
jgi:hypothetical protein